MGRRESVIRFTYMTTTMTTTQKTGLVLGGVVLLLAIIAGGYWLTARKATAPSVPKGDELLFATSTNGFAFCEPLFGDPTNAQKGWLSGCCGPFQKTDAPEKESLIRGSGTTVYYLATNGKRYVFPYTKVLSSWYGPYTDTLQPTFDASVCAQVKQIPDAVLGAIPLGGNVTYRPGVFVTGIESDPKRYVVDAQRMLRPVSDDIAKQIYGGALTERTALLPEPFFVNYVTGSALPDAQIFEPLRVSRASLESELGVRP